MPASWEKHPPAMYSIVTGFFPEASPKQTWATNPRPLLVCGTAKHDATGTYFCRVAYGTTKQLDRAHEDDLLIGNLSMLNAMGLKKPTRFVINSGKQMVILPWTEEFFRPWHGCNSPYIGSLPPDPRNHAGHVLSRLKDLPQF